MFLDRDGVLNKKAPEHQYIRSWREFQFLDGAIEGVVRFCRMGYRVVVVTNQRGIARGLVPPGALDEIHSRMCKAVQERGGEISGVFVCPHEKNTCQCRKPEIGLFLQAGALWDVDKAHSWMIGDSESDILAGKRYGVKTVLIGAGAFGQDFTAASLLDAAERMKKELEL